MNNICSFESFASLNDEKLALLAQRGNDKALDYLLDKYRSFVRNKSTSYFIMGADRDDIIQEGMIGLFKAVRDFRYERGASFKTFADLCVTRQILTAVKNAMRQKHAPLNFYVSLNHSQNESENDLPHYEISDTNKMLNPEDIIINKEKTGILSLKISEVLSDYELLVLSLFLQGKSYEIIGKAIGKDVKSVDNALQRIKRKFEKISAAIE